jgi:hypothetical protein
VNFGIFIDNTDIFPLYNQVKPETDRLLLTQTNINNQKSPYVNATMTAYYHIAHLRNLVKKKLKVAFILPIKPVLFNRVFLGSVIHIL